MKKPIMAFTDSQIKRKGLTITGTPAVKVPACLTLWRIDDEARVKLYKDSLPIQPDYDFYDDFDRWLKAKRMDLSFAQMYVTLKSLSGESSRNFYPFKSSFSFPFLLYIQKQGRSYLYLLDIYNYRDHFCFRINKCAEPGRFTYDKSRTYAPFEHEFSRDEINGFICRVYFRLKSEFRKIEKEYDQFFFKGVRSEAMLFGYREGEFFELHFEDGKGYQEAYELLEARGNSFTASEWAKFQAKADKQINRRAK